MDEISMLSDPAILLLTGNEVDIQYRSVFPMLVCVERTTAKYSRSVAFSLMGMLLERGRRVPKEFSGLVER